MTGVQAEPAADRHGLGEACEHTAVQHYSESYADLGCKLQVHRTTHTYTLSPRTSMSREQLEMLFLRPETSHHHALENHVQDDGAEGRALADTNGDYNT